MSKHDRKGPQRILRGNHVEPKDDLDERYAALCGPVEVRKASTCECGAVVPAYFKGPSEQAAWEAEHQHAPKGCEECGNDDATVTITSGHQVCTDCAQKLDP